MRKGDSDNVFIKIDWKELVLTGNIQDTRHYFENLVENGKI